MNKIVIGENINITVDAISFNDGEKLAMKLTLLDINNKELKVKDTSIEVKNSVASYQLEVNALAKELSVDNLEEIKYVKAWIDANGDGSVDVDYDEHLLIEVVKRKGTLRMGLFFDGTGNDQYIEEEFTNVKKLFDLYPNKIDGEGKVAISDESIFPNTMSAYIRGVGSDSRNEEYDGALSSGFALGMTDRMTGMLFYIQSAVEAYRDKVLKDKKVGYFPETLEFDIFGFSRGSATARHFVNILKQEGDFWSIKIDKKEVDYSVENTKVLTLNIFDTVGSSGIPGRNIDPGFTYHIDPSFIEQKVHHFVADDEYRKNFDGQLSTNNNTDYPININDRKFEEIVLFGAHSDIGGGYINSMYHQVTNNELSKYYLNMMYIKCKDEGVPLGDKPDKSFDWMYEDKLNEFLDDFNKYYNNYPTLKIAHKKLREWQARKRDKFTPYFDSVSMKFKYNHGRNRYSRTIDEVSYSKDILNIFNNDRILFLDFIQKSNTFHDKYVHISHDDIISIDSIGMGSQRDGNILHRDYFIPQKENMQNLNEETMKMLSTPTYSPYGNAGVALSRMNKNFAKLKAEKFEDY